MNKSPHNCLLDLDGVLTNFVQGACDYHGIPNPYEGEDTGVLGNFDLAAAAKMSQNQFWEPLNDHRFWAELEPMPDMEDILHVVESHFRIENIAICTAPSRSPFSASGKMSWVNRYLHSYRRRLIITPAKHFLAHKGSVLIDDRDRNVENFVAAGGRAIRAPRLWNIHWKWAHETPLYIDEVLRTWGEIELDADMEGLSQ